MLRVVTPRTARVERGGVQVRARVGICAATQQKANRGCSTFLCSHKQRSCAVAALGQMHQRGVVEEEDAQDFHVAFGGREVHCAGPAGRAFQTRARAAGQERRAAARVAVLRGEQQRRGAALSEERE